MYLLIQEGIVGFSSCEDCSAREQVVGQHLIWDWEGGEGKGLLSSSVFSFCRWLLLLQLLLKFNQLLLNAVTKVSFQAFLLFLNHQRPPAMFSLVFIANK